MFNKMYFHSAAISTIFKDYDSLLMPQSSPFNVNITNKIPNFIRFIKLARRFGHCKEKMDLMHLYVIRNIANTKNIKVIRGLPALEVLHFQSSGFLKALQYIESPNHLQILPGIKVWCWY